MCCTRKTIILPVPLKQDDTYSAKVRFVDFDNEHDICAMIIIYHQSQARSGGWVWARVRVRVGSGRVHDSFKIIVYFVDIAHQNEKNYANLEMTTNLC